MYRVRNPAECGDCLPYIDVVEEALCFGWIDSTLKRLPDGRLAQRLSLRRKRSHWTELNKQRCADLEARTSDRCKTMSTDNEYSFPSYKLSSSAFGAFITHIDKY